MTAETLPLLFTSIFPAPKTMAGRHWLLSRYLSKESIIIIVIDLSVSEYQPRMSIVSLVHLLSILCKLLMPMMIKAIH